MEYQPIKVTESRQVILTAILCIVVFRGRNWFDFVEFSAIMLFFIPVMILLLVTLYRNHSVAGFRWVVPVLLVCCFSFMAQKNNTSGKDNGMIKFTSFGLSGTFGSYFEEISRASKEPDGCGGYYTQLIKMGTQKKTYYQGGIDMNYNIWRGKYYKFTSGARGFLGSESGGIQADYPSGTSYGITPYVGFDWHWVGFGAGFSIGQMKLPKKKFLL